MEQCPTCGGMVHERGQRSHLRRVPDEVVATRRTGFGDTMTADSVAWHEFRTPARQASIASDVAAPALQSLVTASATMVVAVLLVVWLNVSWLAVPTAGAIAFAAMWLVLLAEHRRSLWNVERYEPARDVKPEDPPKPNATTRLVVNTGRQTQERELPITPDTLLKLSKVLANGVRTFSERELAGRGRLLSGRGEYEQVRDVLMTFGWLRWKSADKRQGLEITPAGRAGLQALATGRATAEELLD